MITPQKLWKMLNGPRPFDKALVALNSTPLRYPIKRALVLSYKQKKTMRRSAASALTGVVRLDPHVEHLRRHGYAIVDSIMDPVLLQQLHDESARLVQRADSISQNGDSKFSNKNFWARLLDEDMVAGRLTTDSVFVKFAMQPDLIRTVAAYFGEIPVIGYVFLSLSRYVPQPLTASQLWHRDRDDVRVLKLFTYLSDVNDASCGPFTFYPKQISANVKDSFIPKHMPDRAIARFCGDVEPTRMFGPRFSSFLVDTAECYHMGSRVEEGKTRLMYTASFISAPPMFPNFNNHIVITGNESQIQSLLVRV